MTFAEVERAIKRGDITRLRHELECGLDPNLSNRYGWTILMVAAMHGNTVIGRLLIEKGAALDNRNKFRDTALSLAIQTGHPSFVKLLLTSGAYLECHPHGNSLEIFIDWVGQYAKAKVQTEHIKHMFDDERMIRNQAK